MSAPPLTSHILAQVLKTARAAGSEPNLEPMAALQRDYGDAAYAELARVLSLPLFTTQDLLKHRAAWGEWPMARALAKRAVLLQTENGMVAVSTNPFDTALSELLRSRATQSGQACQAALAAPLELEAYLRHEQAQVRALDGLHAEGEGNTRSGAALIDYATSSDASMGRAVQLVASTLYDALKSQASDVHIESTAQGLTVKYRSDGVLETAAQIAGVELAEQVVSRIKVLAELDIAERRVPQDGGFRIQNEGREIDLRVSVMPSAHGEDAVIRILDKRAVFADAAHLSLDALKLQATDIAALRALIKKPHGLLLVTGPTGSGKTTTLYAALAEINSGRDKIITIEDPVEYQLQGVTQIPVNDKKGLTFARGLRSVLRHDPDIIMVGEIRDKETAEIAVQAALTGHLVLTTVHANNVFDVFGRFSHMGLDLYAFASALNGIWAQRLIRVLCVHCAQDAPANAQDANEVGVPLNTVLKTAQGCAQCRGSGYKGRRAIAEILPLDEELREIIVERKPTRVLREAAQRKGLKALRHAALQLVLRGETSLAEANRVTSE